MAVHFALRRAFTSQTFAREKLGSLFNLLCPPVLDIEVAGRRLQLNKNQGEFLLLLFLVARFHELYSGMRRYRGFSAQMLAEEQLATFPRNVVPEERRKRTYWNAVLARAEVESSYRPARQLWRRERAGHYVPNSGLLVRVADGAASEDSFVPLVRLMGLELLEPGLRVRASTAGEQAP